MTVLDVVTTALKEIGVLSAGEALPAEEGADALAALNRYVSQKSAERLAIYTIGRTLFTITSGLGSYSVGTGFSVNTPRPMFVDRVTYIDTSTTPDTEYPLGELDEDQYVAIPQKALESTIPSSYYYQPTFPTGTINLFPIPTSSSLQGVLYAPTAVAAFSALGDTVSLPPGYEEMLVTNLAVRLCSSYSRQPDPLLVMRAREAEAIVKRSNDTPKEMYFPGDALINGGGRYSIYTDGPI